MLLQNEHRKGAIKNCRGHDLGGFLPTTWLLAIGLNTCGEFLCMKFFLYLLLSTDDESYRPIYSIHFIFMCVMYIYVCVILSH